VRLRCSLPRAGLVGVARARSRRRILAGHRTVVGSHQVWQVLPVQPRERAVGGTTQDSTENLPFLREEGSQDQAGPVGRLHSFGTGVVGAGWSDTETETGIAIRSKTLLDGLEAVVASGRPRRPDAHPAQR